MPTTNDPNDPELTIEDPENNQRMRYLVLSEQELAAGFVRPVRMSYEHLVCKTVTSMSMPIAVTYARKPEFYTHTYCGACAGHFPVDEFVWDGTDEKVGS